MITHPNETLIKRFYDAFAARDADSMASAYHPEATFSDPVFQNLQGLEVGAMWRMLCERGKDLDVAASGISANDSTGRADWSARYTFGATGRPVHNRITATFAFRDGKIVEHRDEFDLYKWSRMALGPLGVVLGWTPVVQGRVRRQARSQLDRFMAG